MPRFDVICLGYSAVDFIGVVPCVPELDTKLEMSDFMRQGGGPAATAAVAAARLGARAAFAGNIGDDDFADFMVDELAAERVDTSHVTRCTGARSQFAFIMVERGTGKRTIVWTRSSVPPMRLEALDREFVTSCRVLHLDRHEVDAGMVVARWVREAGGVVSLDAGNYDPRTLELLPVVDYLIAPGWFARDSTGETDPMAGARALLGGRQAVVVTRGEDGCWVATQDDEFHAPAFRVEAIDTNGAGDVFCGAFACGLSQGWNVRRCAVFASAAAALKCTRLGGRAGIPTREEALALADAREGRRGGGP